MATARFHLPLPLSSSSSPFRSSCCSSSSHFHLRHRALSPTANKTLTHIKNSGVIACLRAQRYIYIDVLASSLFTISCCIICTIMLKSKFSTQPKNLPIKLYFGQLSLFCSRITQD